MGRRSDDLPLKQVLDNLFKDYHLEEKYLSTKVPAIWREAVGNFIADRTVKMFVDNNILTVHLSSSPLKQEVSFNKEKIIGLVNEKLGTSFIKELRIK